MDVVKDMGGGLEDFEEDDSTSRRRMLDGKLA